MAKQQTEKKSSENKSVDFNGKYFYALGRRKSSTATVRLFAKGKGDVLVNGKKLEDYFPNEIHQMKVLSPLSKTSLDKKFDLSVKVSGGGVTGQAEAIRLGLSRALLLMQSELRPVIKAEGFLTRDARVKERKKPGLKRARRAPQWQKR